MGETAADFLSHGPLQLGYGLASLVLVSGVIACLLAERRSFGNATARYWVTIVVMATAGTTLADFLSRTLQLGYLWSTVLLVVLLAVTLVAWPHDKTVGQTGARYWSSIMIASTLGTTLGDALSNGTALGFGGSTAALGVLLMSVLAIGRWTKRASELVYWSALMLTSTIGATSGDYLSKEEGLNFGYFWSNTVLIALFVGVIAFTRWRALKTATE